MTHAFASSMVWPVTGGKLMKWGKLAALTGMRARTHPLEAAGLQALRQAAFMMTMNGLGCNWLSGGSSSNFSA